MTLTVFLASPAAYAAPPTILVVPFQPLGEGVSAEVADQVTSLLARELVGRGLGVQRSDVERPRSETSEAAETAAASGSAIRATGAGAESVAPSTSSDAPRVKERVEALLAKGRTDLEQSEFSRAADAFAAGARIIEERAQAVQDLSLLSEAYLQMGVAHFRDRRETLADVSLAKSVHFDPERRLNVDQYPPLFVGVYDRVRTEVLRRTRSIVAVDAPQGAEVRLDGRRMGRGSLVLEHVLPGPHWIEIALPGTPPRMRRIDVDENARTSVDSSTLEAGEAPPRPQIVSALRANRLGPPDREHLARSASTEGAGFALVGVVFRLEDGFQLRTILLPTDGAPPGRLLDVGFDLELLSVELEVYKLAEDVVREAGRISRPLAVDGKDSAATAIAPEYRPARNSRARAVETSAPRVRAAPPPPPPPPPIGGTAVALVPAAMDRREALAVRTPGAGVLRAPSRRVEVVESGTPSSVDRSSADLGDGERPKWWVWALVGAAVASAAAGGGYLMLANHGEREGNLRVSWP